jgi:hypothetical protein
MRLPHRFVGILLSPRETFIQVAADPRWLGMLVLTTLVGVVTTGAFLATDTGRQAWVDQAVAQAESFGVAISDAQYSRLQQMADWAALLTAAQIVVTTPLVTVALAGIVFATLTAGLGGGATFRQVLAVVTHAGAVRIVRDVFVLPLNFVRESLASATTLAVFFPMLDEGSFLARLLGTLDVFVLWGAALLAVGLSVLYQRPARRVFAGLLAAYAALAVLVASALLLLGGV